MDFIRRLAMGSVVRTAGITICIMRDPTVEVWFNVLVGHVVRNACDRIS